MKKRFTKYFLLLAAMAYLPTQAKNVTITEANFPDAIFRQYVQEKFDTDKDGVLSDTELSAVKKISVRVKGIKSLVGIAHFTKLDTLDCYKNSLSTLNIDRNTMLTYLDCDRNSLSTLNVGKNKMLTYLDCSNNSISSINISMNTQLEHFYCSRNTLSSLDISKNPKLIKLLCSNNSISTLDVSKNTQLEGLRCNNNSLSSLDVSKNKLLKALWCDHNSLTSLNVSRNTQLKTLWCSDNFISSIDLSKDTLLTWLDCSENAISNIDLRGNTKMVLALKEQFIQCNDISAKNGHFTLDMRKVVGEGNIDSISIDTSSLVTDYKNGIVTFSVNPIGKSFTYDFRIKNKSGMMDVTVDITGATTNVPTQTQVVAITRRHFRDNKFRQYVRENFDTDKDGQLSKVEILAVKDIIVTGKYAKGKEGKIESLSGIELFTELESLFCRNNLLTSLNVSKNTKLENLDCSENRLSSLNVSKNIRLEYLNCRGNFISSLNVSKNINLKIFYCDQELLKTINLKNNKKLNQPSDEVEMVLPTMPE